MAGIYKNKNMETCDICNKQFNKKHGLHTHLISYHKFKLEQVKEYYDAHYKVDGEGICPFTETPTKFLGLSRGYAKFSDDPITRKKSLSTNSMEYLMKVKKMTEAEALEYKHKMKEFHSVNNKLVFERKNQEDPTFIKSMSRYCKEFWIKKGFSEEVSIEKANAECAKNRAIFETKMKAQPENYKNKWQSQLQYWIDRGHSYEDAKMILHEKQRTFALEKLIEKYGEAEAIKKWNTRQAKWMSSYKKSNFSRVSQMLFIDIYDKLKNKYFDMLFAVLDENKQFDWSGINHELVLSLQNKTIKPDFIIPSIKKIIEFDGAYWHGDKLNGYVENKKRIDQRDSLLSQEGYIILHVHELDYYKDKTKVLNECIKFLTDESI